MNVIEIRHGALATNDADGIIAAATWTRPNHWLVVGPGPDRSIGYIEKEYDTFFAYLDTPAHGLVALEFQAGDTMVDAMRRLVERFMSVAA